MKLITLETVKQGTVTFTGELLGSGTSRSDVHQDNPARKCRHCRWMTCEVYGDDGDRFYALTTGHSRLEGEINLARWIGPLGAHALIDKLVVRNSDQAFLPAPSRDALAAAADEDDLIASAFRNLLLP